jgi:hypothetical protein
VTRPKLCEGVGCLVVAPEDMMKFKTTELLLKLSYLLVVCCHVGIAVVRFPHDLVDDKLGIAVDVKSLDHKLGSNAWTVDEGLVFCYIVCHAEMQLNHVE